MLMGELKWVQFDATAAEVGDLLFAEFYVWEHMTGTYDISTEEYHIPTHLEEHIDYITPGTRLRQRNIKRGNVRPQRAGLIDDQVSVRPLITQLPGFPFPNSSVCDVYVTAECTRGMVFLEDAYIFDINCGLVQYNIPEGTTDHFGNQLGIFESLDVHYSRKDLDIYYSTLYP